jgi:3-oxoacyl-[acyl-carrier-protein] synthase III
MLKNINFSLFRIIYFSFVGFLKLEKMTFLNTIITGTGSYTPKKTIKNDWFCEQDFFTENQRIIPLSGEDIIRKFNKITGIDERRYADDGMNCSDLAGFCC